jgi:secreted protein with Ig-like and vWFA domain
MDAQASFPTSIWNGLTANTWRDELADDINPDARDWDRVVAEVQAVQEAVGVGTAAATAGTPVVGATVVETSNGIIHQTKITLNAFSVATVDADTAGAHGSAVIYTFPAGVIQVLGGTFDLTLTKVGASITDTAALVSAIGTAATATDNATLVGTGEGSIVPSAATTLSSGAGTSKGKSTATTMAAGVFDGTSSNVEARLNLAVAAADHDVAAAAVEYTGTVTITWINHGDN